MRLAPGLLLGAACAAVIACAGSRPSPRSAPAAAMQSPAPSEPRDEIAALDREIAAQLTQAQVAPPAAAACSGAACTTAMAEPFATPSAPSAPSAGDAACHPAPGPRCHDVCTLSDSICKDQQRICDLARQLAGDDWAAGKCTGARASCLAAHDSCCSCVL